MTAPVQMLAKLARQSASAWMAMAAQAFPGEASLETSNTVYRFKDGVFVSRVQKPARSFDAPREMRGLRLIGFLAYEDGLWSLSPRWRKGSIAVLWKPGGDDERSFVITSATIGWAIDAPPKRERSAASISGIMRRRESRPPTLRRPAPPSMTRVLANASADRDLR